MNGTGPRSKPVLEIHTLAGSEESCVGDRRGTVVGSDIGSVFVPELGWIVIAAQSVGEYAVADLSRELIEKRATNLLGAREPEGLDVIHPVVRLAEQLRETSTRDSRGRVPLNIHELSLKKAIPGQRCGKTARGSSRFI